MPAPRFVVYESLPDYGPDDAADLGSFPTREEAEAFAAECRREVEGQDDAPTYTVEPA